MICVLVLPFLNSLMYNIIFFPNCLSFQLNPNMQPYFSILSTYLSCAMAHLNVGVQSDSLKLMNVLVAHTPSLIARHANTLLKNFIDLISRKVRMLID